jgi:hypothetical protein
MSGKKRKGGDMINDQAIAGSSIKKRGKNAILSSFTI